MIDVELIDHWAASGSGSLHRASPISKIFCLLLVVSAAVVAKNPYAIMVGYAILLLVSAATKLPWKKLAILSLYGAVFALLYVLTLHATLTSAMLFIFKAITPALAVLILIATTPYPKIFGVFGKILPEILAAGLFMTYRTLFILLKMMSNFGAAIRLRGGFTPGTFSKNSANISRGLGMLLVRAVERSSRLYAVMSVRGYSGKMAGQERIRLESADWLPAITGSFVLFLAVAWR